MTTEQLTLFQRYVGLGEERTLKQLHDIIRQEPIYAHISYRQLQRMSHKFSWAAQATKVSSAVVQQVQQAMEPVIKSMVQEQIGALHTLQRRFLERVALDPSDPTLSDTQKARAIDPDFRDFQDAVKLERLILGDPTERKEIVTAESRLVDALSKDELIRLARDAAAKRFGAVVARPEAVDADFKALPSTDNE